MAPAPQRPQHNRTDHTAVPVHDADLSLHVTQHTELPHVTEPSLTVPPLSCPEPPAGPQYPLELAPESLQRPPSFGSSHNSASPSHASSVSPGQKLLTGVAPSGSSKNKARREQEAREKRRKLSEAALLAVRKAGGDVEALEAVLC
ncbi:hypothetical protein CISG_01743 [Coccidioides immitis RMSCC 3703]|uniref:Uncharacterized protein n=1 Tax=Coccidioides immitis RMSCC 3703 TaxID=454286 RepID=A0A0J8R4T0_COCIT|nr:hypothetical protein CISG_01743 [Coccidioides immitis RMSCC 3703]